ncbi:hypothetical protein POTOM_042172 [Populus tomentosa]|uniref:26S proteasome regulatory subunit RPN7 n=1 Tax=Populus tomentosa TaxID=118781 RepID=A0A8X8CHF6_POPTO|nr:hypothetical protein POTOM_042172 [Populus tomentosa]
MENQEGTQQPHLVLAHELFLLTHHDVQDIEKVRLKEEVLTAIKSDDMVPLYETLVAESLLEKDQGLLDSMRAKNEDELKNLDEKLVRVDWLACHDWAYDRGTPNGDSNTCTFDCSNGSKFYHPNVSTSMVIAHACICKKFKNCRVLGYSSDMVQFWLFYRIADAEENLGESEVREAHLAKSLFYIRIGDKDKALEQLKVTEGKTVAVGQRMDLVFYTLQLGFFYMDFDLISKSIDKAKNLFEEGGDWERKNRLKVYEGLYCLSARNFKKAADLFLDSISTFTTYELFPYDTFIFYTVLTSIISLDRVSLKQKVVDAPEILTVIGKIPHLSEFLNSLYDCQYKSFFSAFAGLTEQIKLDRYLHPHFRYYMREVRTVVYSQFLESYKSVTIEAMAKAFGVTVEFIDLELSRFIAAGKLHCKIDKVAGVLETNRPDAKNALYQATIKQGDFLLNRIQKLSRVIDL